MSLGEAGASLIKDAGGEAAFGREPADDAEPRASRAASA